MSSSDEDISYLADCVVDIPSTERNVSSENEKLLSNRILPEEHKQYDYKNVKVSKAFQKHVSKHLEAILDKTKFVDVKEIKVKKRKKKNVNNVVTLLSSSEKPLQITENVNQFKKQKKPQGLHNEPYEEIERRAKEVAVTAEYVLSKVEVQHWALENRGKVEIIQCTSKKQ